MRAQTTWRCCPTIAREVRCLGMERPVAAAAAAAAVDGWGGPEQPDLPLSCSEWRKAPLWLNVVTRVGKGAE